MVEKRLVLKGYELYLVEQWACSRESPTLVIATWTGDDNHSIVVGVLAIPQDESLWSDRVRFYFKAISQYHARPKETSHGELLVTNLSSFPSALTVIPVPDGDIREHRRDFIVNENLKRLGCSGRSGMTLLPPSEATRAKFYQLYKTSERVDFSQAVIELVKLCQVALVLFGKLEPEYVDGLLCDKTEAAIGNWWTELGAEYYNVEPTDGILGPTTVAALLGMLAGARNRLSAFGAPVAKDVFDMESTKRGIGYFQKQKRLERTRRLDRQTLLKLHATTARAAAGEGWGVQKKVKSTVAEIGGRRGEMVIGMVGGKDKGGIADIETLDLDRFIELVQGERAKWLWHGKKRRAATDSDRTSDVASIFVGRDDGSAQAGRRVQSLPVDEEPAEQQRRQDEMPTSVYSNPPPGSATSMAADGPGDRDPPRRTVFKSVAGRMSDARSGLGRIKDAAGRGLRGHASRPSKDESPDSALLSPTVSALAQSSAGVSSPVGVGRAFTWKNKPEEYANGFRKDQQPEPKAPPSMAGLLQRELTEASSAAEANSARALSLDEPSQSVAALSDPKSGLDTAPEARRELSPEAAAPSVPASVAGENGNDMQCHEHKTERDTSMARTFLQRRHSVAVSATADDQPTNPARWPRRLSFGDAEDAVLRWEELDEDDMDALLSDGAAFVGKTRANGEQDDTKDVAARADPEGPATEAALRRQERLAALARSMYGDVLQLSRSLAPWVESQVASVEALDAALARDYGALRALEAELAERTQSARRQWREELAARREEAADKTRDVELLLQRLDYEMAGLENRADELDDGVLGLARQVADVEAKADELRQQLETESWLHWAVRTLTGIGTGPNIVRPPTEKKKSSLDKERPKELK